MRGIGSTLSRLPAARAVIAGAAILAGAFCPAAQAQTARNAGADETALAIPRVAPPEAGAAPVPQPLAPSEAARVRRIFALQTRGDLDEAARQTRLLTDTTLLGHILADRYLGRFRRASVDDLESWLAHYAAQPDAPAIHALLQRRLPRGAALPPLPVLDSLAETDRAVSAPEGADPGAHAIPRNPLLDRTVGERAREGHADSALRLIARTKGMSPSYAALLRAEVARSLFEQNEDAEALEIASSIVRRTPPEEQPGLAGYVAGLAAWRLNRPELACPNFEAAARAAYTPGGLRAAAAFWAARAHLRTGDAAGFAPWMKRAAKEPRTFYGLLARSTLGIGTGFAWWRNVPSEADVDAVAATPEGLRAFALLQVEQPDRAEDELRLLWPKAKNDPGLRNAILLVAREIGLTDLVAQLTALLEARDGMPREFDEFPLPRLRPRYGFRVDPALVYALARVESNFDASAVSPVGARGLMQLMPVTASYIASDPSLARRGARLRDPAINLEVGQRYLTYLAQQDTISGDLIRTLASYNAGPGSFMRWSAAIRDKDDPLLFIEAIPIEETRHFVQHALAYTWIYAERLGLPAPSLDELAAGAYPRFTPLAKAEKISETVAPRIH